MRKLGFQIITFFLLFAYSSLFPQNGKGVYIWPSSFYESGGIDKVLDTLKQNKITDIFLLVKGEEGYSLFPSDYTIHDFYYKLSQKENNQTLKDKYSKLNSFFSDPNLLSDIIDKSHKNNIKVHAWFIISGDKNYIRLHPGSEVVKIPKTDSAKYPMPVIDKGHINLAYPPYKPYIFSLINKALEYPFDGLMLDKIRYTNLAYSWDEIHISKALRLGVDINKVIDCAIKTCYGSTDDKDLFFSKYREGDKDIRQWIEIKKYDIEDYVKEARKITSKKNIALSASFMPEGAYNTEFQDVHYAQNYSELSKYLDYIVIMAYARDFNEPATWLKMVAANAKVRSSCKIWTAIQGFNTIDDQFVFDQVKNARIANSDGIAVFRFGPMTQGMWRSFNKGMELDVKPFSSTQIKGIIYSGNGTIMNCVAKSSDALVRSENIIPFSLDEYSLKDYKSFSDKKFILVPGGGGSLEASALGTEGLKNIDKFVSSGGGYIGVCAGSYLPVKGYNKNLTSELQIVNAQIVDLEHWNRGSGKVKLEIKSDNPIFSGINTKDFEMNYFSGPVLEPSDLNLPKYKELAQFKSEIHENGAPGGVMLGKTAILESQYKKGKIILFSPHPELTKGMEDMLSRAVEYVSHK